MVLWIKFYCFIIRTAFYISAKVRLSVSSIACRSSEWKKLFNIQYFLALLFDCTEYEDFSLLLLNDQSMLIKYASQMKIRLMTFIEGNKFGYAFIEFITIVEKLLLAIF